MPCRAYWTPILFSLDGREIAWICEKCNCIHQKGPVLNNWPSGDGKTISLFGDVGFGEQLIPMRSNV